MNLIRWFRGSTSATKWFIFNVFIWMILLIITTVYSYARLEFVRSGPPTPLEQIKEKIEDE